MTSDPARPALTPPPPRPPRPQQCLSLTLTRRSQLCPGDLYLTAPLALTPVLRPQPFLLNPTHLYLSIMVSTLSPYRTTVLRARTLFTLQTHNTAPHPALSTNPSPL